MIVTQMRQNMLRSSYTLKVGQTVFFDLTPLEKVGVSWPP